MLKSILYYLIKKYPSEAHESVMDRIEKNHASFYFHHERLQSALSINTFSDPLKNSPKLGIVIQGPIDKNNDFTLETAKLYKKHFENTVIILSTWKNEDSQYLKNFENAGIEIVLSKQPTFKGHGNVNYQIISSSAGIIRARELGAEYAIKSRTDQRMYAPNIKAFLLNILKTFPVALGYSQKERIIGISLDTFKYRLYGLSDMFSFGHIDDMVLYWSPELDNKEDQEISGDSIRIFCSKPVCEVYFCTEFLKKIGRKNEFTLEDSWNAFVNHFCIVDSTTALDLFWNKYGRHSEYRYTVYDAIKTSQELNFREWLNLYAGIYNKSNIPEFVLDQKFNTEIKF